jgi:acyl-homoserine lactone acylase PvdQ
LICSDLVLFCGFRHIVDLGDVERSLYLNPLGQNGNQLSSMYDNLLEKWSIGQYLNMTTAGYTVAERKVLKRG